MLDAGVGRHEDPDAVLDEILDVLVRDLVERREHALRHVLLDTLAVPLRHRKHRDRNVLRLDLLRPSRGDRVIRS
jgi:hypothetical protein